MGWLDRVCAHKVSDGAGEFYRAMIAARRELHARCGFDERYFGPFREFREGFDVFRAHIGVSGEARRRFEALVLDVARSRDRGTRLFRLPQ